MRTLTAVSLALMHSVAVDASMSALYSGTCLFFVSATAMQVLLNTFLVNA